MGFQEAVINFPPVKKKYLTPGLFSGMIAQVMEMEKIVWQGLLYDFYGELLTEHQRRIYEDVACNDLSLSEIAREQGITRQGVHDLVKRCDRILEGYEDKLHLVAKFQQTKALAGQIQNLLDSYRENQDMTLLTQAREMANQITQI